MKNYVILRRSGWTSREELEKAAERSARVGQIEMPERVRWIRSYITHEAENRLGTVCVYQAIDQESLREHARRAGLPCDLIVPVVHAVIINEDPLIAA
jgi:hypothetical protein